MNARLSVTASFSVTISVDESDSLDGEKLKSVVAENLDDLIRAGGGIRDFIDSIQLASVSTDDDVTIIAGADA